MHPIYKIHNNNNVFYKLLSVVFRWLKQRKCTHDWRAKGFGIMDTPWFKSTERRCCICKKVEYNSVNK